MFFFQIQIKVPIELCTNVRKDEKSVTLSRGRPRRKEGEKRRRKVSNFTLDTRKRGADNNIVEPLTGEKIETFRSSLRKKKNL